MIRRLLAAIAVLTLLTAAAGCSEETSDDARDTIDSAGDDISDAVDDAGDSLDDAGDAIGDKTDQATARTAAETFRSALRDDSDAQDRGYRLIDAIERAGADLPGDAELSGVEDEDGDGFDDDGDVQIDVDGESACVRIPEDGDDIEVEGGAC